jgi:hypothetical protein
MAYHELSTRHLWEAKASQELRALRIQKGKSAFAAVFNFIFFVVVAAGTCYAIMTMPQWLPQVQTYIAEAGWVEKFFLGVQTCKEYVGLS